MASASPTLIFSPSESLTPIRGMRLASHARAHDGRSEPLAERLVAADVIAVVVRVQNKVQPPIELLPR